MADEKNVVLLLDLAIENPIDPDIVLERLPPGSAPPVIHRVTKFGDVRCATGTPGNWAPVIKAINQMVETARSAERTGTRCRYWIAGRAGLPAFFYLGYRLTGMAQVTLVNARKYGPIDVLALDWSNNASVASQPYFERSPWPVRPDLAEIRANLLVSSQIRISSDQVRILMASHGASSGAVVEAHAAGPLDETSLTAALRELDEIVAGIRSWYPGCGALSVFIAGPATLAFVVGRAMNPHIFADVQVFHHRDNRYQLAYETKPSPVARTLLPAAKTPEHKQHTILFLAANPAVQVSLDLGREARGISEELKRSGKRDLFKFEPRSAAQPLDLLRELRELKPTVVHFSGHGRENGLYFQAADGLPQLVTGKALANAFGSIEDSVDLVVLNACYSERQAKDLCSHVKGVVGMSAKVNNRAAQTFAIGFYGALGDGASVGAAFKQGCVAIDLDGLEDADRPQLETQSGVDVNSWFLAGTRP